MQSKQRGGKRPGAGRKAIEYRPEYAHIAHQAALLGATDAQIAAFFKVTETVIQRWKKQHPEFAKAIKDGKLMADAEVAHGLYRIAIGYQCTETQRKEVVNENGEKRLVEVITITKDVPPDHQACRFWLCNRQPALWKWRGPAVTTEPAVEQKPEPLH